MSPWPSVAGFNIIPNLKHDFGQADLPICPEYQRNDRHSMRGVMDRPLYSECGRS